MDRITGFDPVGEGSSPSMVTNLCKYEFDFLIYKLKIEFYDRCK